MASVGSDRTRVAAVEVTEVASLLEPLLQLDLVTLVLCCDMRVGGPIVAFQLGSLSLSLSEEEEDDLPVCRRLPWQYFILQDFKSEGTFLCLARDFLLVLDFCSRASLYLSEGARLGSKEESSSLGCCLVSSAGLSDSSHFS